jgi:RNA polymerase sigma factor (sigma-70 family)
MNEKEYNTCVKDYSDNVFRYLVKNLQDKDLSKDILQDSFLNLWNKRQSVDYKTAKTYLFQIAHNTMINTLKYNNKKQTLDTPTDLSASSNYDLNQTLTRLMDFLPNKQRQSLLLRDYEGYSYKEIAEIMSIKEEDVKINIFRARGKMKEMINKIEEK